LSNCPHNDDILSSNERRAYLQRIKPEISKRANDVNVKRDLRFRHGD
jgi:hypothetical protein